MSYNPYYYRTPAVGQLEPLIPNLGQAVGAGVQSGVQIQSAPYMVQQQQARAMEMDALAKQQQIKTLLSFAGPASYGVLTADEKDQPGLYDNFRNQVNSIFPQLGQKLPQTWNDEAKSYLTQTYQESQQVKDLMTRNMLAQEFGSHGVDTSHLFPGAQGASQAGSFDQGQAQQPGQPNWTDILTGSMIGGGPGYELSRLGVEGGIQGIRSQYDLEKVTGPDGTPYYVPKSAMLGIPNVSGKGGTGTTSPNLPSAGAQPGTPTVPNAPSTAPSGTTAPPPEIGGPSQPFTPDGGSMVPGVPMGQAPAAGISPTTKKLMEGEAENALTWQTNVNKQAEAAKNLQPSIEEAFGALQNFNPSAAEPTKLMLQRTLNFVTGLTGAAPYTGELDSVNEFNKPIMDATRLAVRETSARAAVQEFNMIQKTFPGVSMPDRETAAFLLNVIRASKVDFPVLTQQYIQRYAGANHGNIIGAQEKWNAYADPFAIALMRMPQSQVDQMAASLNKTPQGRSLLQTWAKSEQFFKSSGLAPFIQGNQ